MAELLAWLRAPSRRLKHDGPPFRMAGCMILALGLGTGEFTGFDPRYYLYDSAEIPVPVDGAVVCLVREQVVRTRRLPYERVHLDEVAVGLLPQQSWLVMQVTCGPHRISGIASCPDLTLYALARDREALCWYETAQELGTDGVYYIAPAHLRQAQIHERLGHRDQAIYHYREFVDLWKDCDAELRPQVDEARARVVALVGQRG